MQLLVGQTASINLQMAPSTVQETVTVTAEAPLLNVTTSSLGGNVDPQQVQELPVAGRNWMALALLAPGSRTSSTNATAPLPDRNGGEAREFQLNLDGQQISSELGTGNQPRFSQDSIAEFQFISNRFDATQGRSTGVQVNAITKSGTNALSGLFRANFRDSKLQRGRSGARPRRAGRATSSSARPSAVRSSVTGCTTSATSSTSANPLTSIWNTPYPAFNIELIRKVDEKDGGHPARLPAVAERPADGQGVGPQHLRAVRRRVGRQPPGVDDRATTSTTASTSGSLTQVLSNRAVNEIKGGYSHFGFETRRS